MGVPLITSNPGSRRSPSLVHSVVCPPVIWSPVGASSLFHPLMRRMQLYELSQRFKIGFQHFQAAPLIAWASPVVAVDAADKNLAIVVDLR